MFNKSSVDLTFALRESKMEILGEIFIFSQWILSNKEIDINGPVQGSNAFRCQWRLCAVVTRMRKETLRNWQIQNSSMHLTTQVLFPREADEGGHVQRSTVKAMTLTVSATNRTFHSQQQLLFADQGPILFTWRISSNLEVFLLLGCHGLKI